MASKKTEVVQFKLVCGKLTYITNRTFSQGYRPLKIIKVKKYVKLLLLKY